MGASNPITVKSGRGVSSCQDRCCFGASLSHRKSPNSISAWLSTVSQSRRLKGYVVNLASFSLSTVREVNQGTLGSNCKVYHRYQYRKRKWEIGLETNGEDSRTLEAPQRPQQTRLQVLHTLGVVSFPFVF